MGPPVEQIVEASQRFDVIVLGQKTHFRFDSPDEPDDTLSEVVKHGPRPVVAVPRSRAAGGAVVVAYDGSLQASRALFALVATGLAAMGTVHVVAVGEHREILKRRAESAIDFLDAHAIGAEPHLAVTERPAGAVILEEARRLGAGLLVLGAYGQPRLREFVFGSVTRQLLEESPVPLFLFH